MINRIKINHFLIFIIIIFIQIYFPIINLSKIQIQPDVILVYITVIGLMHGRFYAIIIISNSYYVRPITNS